MGRPLRLEDLYELSLISDPQISPDGDRVAYVVTRADQESDENRSSIWLVDVATGESRQATNGPSDASPRWMPDAGALLFIRRDAGKAQVWRLPMEPGEPVKVTSASSGLSAFFVSPDSTRLAYTAAVDLDGEFSDDEQKKRASLPVVIDRLNYKADGAGLIKRRRSHLFVVDLGNETSEPRQLTSGDFSTGTPAWSPDGTRLAYSASTRDDRDVNPGSAIFTVSVTGDSDAQPVRHTADTGTAAAPVWLSNERILFAGRPDSAPGHIRLYTLDLDRDAGALAEPHELTPGFDRNVMLGAPAYPGSIPRIAGGNIVFCARDRGCTHVYRVPTDGGTPERIAGTAATTASSITVAPSAGCLVHLSSSTTSPGDIVVAALDGSEPRTLTNAMAALTDVDLLTPEERSFTAPDGTEVHGWIVRAPATQGPSPLLLDVHGGPHNAWNPTFDGVHLYHQVLANDGWTILYLNPRGSDGYGEHFYTGVVEGWGTADLDDFLTPLQTLVDEGIADPARAATTGYSYGGYMTCWLTSRTDRFAAAITGGCLTNHVSFFGTSDAGWHLGMQEVGGAPAEPKRLHEHSPITYVGAVTAPTLVLHGESDDRCPIEQAEQWFAALRAQGVTTQFVRYPGASHLFIALGRPSHRVDYNRRIVDWLNAHVPIS